MTDGTRAGSVGRGEWLIAAFATLIAGSGVGYVTSGTVVDGVPVVTVQATPTEMDAEPAPSAPPRPQALTDDELDQLLADGIRAGLAFYDDNVTHTRGVGFFTAVLTAAASGDQALVDAVVSDIPLWLDFLSSDSITAEAGDFLALPDRTSITSQQRLRFDAAQGVVAHLIASPQVGAACGVVLAAQWDATRGSDPVLKQRFATPEFDAALGTCTTWSQAVEALRTDGHAWAALLGVDDGPFFDNSIPAGIEAGDLFAQRGYPFLGLSADRTAEPGTFMGAAACADDAMPQYELTGDALRKLGDLWADGYFTCVRQVEMYDEHRAESQDQYRKGAKVAREVELKDARVLPALALKAMAAFAEASDR